MHRLVLVLLLSLGLGGSALAKEEVPTPAEAFAQAVGRMPLPSRASDFDLTFDVRSGGESIGTAFLGARAVGRADDARWVLRHSLDLTKPRRQQATVMTLSRGLRMSSGSQYLARGAAAGGVVERGTRYVAWKRDVESLDVWLSGELEAPKQVSVPDVGPTLGGLAGAVLFGRHCRAEDAHFTYSILRPGKIGDSGEQPTRPVTLEVEASGWYGTRRALILTHSSSSGSPTVIYLDPTTRDVLAIERAVSTRSAGVSYVPKRSAPVGSAESSTQPGSARDLAERALFAFATHDMESLEPLFHWPTLARNVMGGPQEPAVVEAFRKSFLQGVLKGLRNTSTAQPPEVARTMVGENAAELREEPLSDGRVRLTYGEVLANMQFVAARIDGRWLLVELPKL